MARRLTQAIRRDRGRHPVGSRPAAALQPTAFHATVPGSTVRLPRRLLLMWRRSMAPRSFSQELRAPTRLTAMRRLYHAAVVWDLFPGNTATGAVLCAAPDPAQAPS